MSKNATTYTYEHKELVALMLKDANIKEGIWALSVNFRLGAASFGASPEEVFPTGFVSVESLGIQKVEHKAGTPIPPIAYDAAELNP